MNPVKRFRNEDEGASLVFALAFLAICAIFLSAGLNKGFSATASSTKLRDRAQLQYAIDGGASRALQVLQNELKSGTPTHCTKSSDTSGVTPPLSQSADPSGFSVNGYAVTYTCATLAGRAASNNDQALKNFAIVTTDATNGLTTGNAVNNALLIGGSVFLRAQNADVQKEVDVENGGDVVMPYSGATCNIGVIPNVKLVGNGGLKTCTNEPYTSALPSYTLPSAPSVNVSAAYWDDKTGAGPNGKTCRVFFPGYYNSPPNIANADSYFFASGYYYFDNVTLNFDKVTAFAGQPDPAGTDVGPDPTQSAIPGNDACNGVGNSDVVTNLAKAKNLPGAFSGTAISGFGYGATFILGGSSSITLKGGNSSNNTGTLAMFSPTSQAVPVSLYTVPAGTSGYDTWNGGGYVLDNQNSNVSETFNGKVYAQNAPVHLFASNNSSQAAYDGVIAQTLELDASASGTGLALSAQQGPGNPPPPFRTVHIVASDASATTSGASTATVDVVAKIDNFNYKVAVLSWRVGTQAN